MSKEERRLASLYDLEILDTPPDEALDELTQLASQIAGTPIALVSLIDKDRQWFKSRVGLDALETPRDVAFCHHAIEQDEIYIVEDSRKDKLFSENPLVTGAPHVIFYAGIPLKLQDGSNIGTLCVINHKPQKLSSHQINQLKMISKQAIRHIQLSHKVDSQLRISQMLKRLHGLSFDNSDPLEKVINHYLNAGSELFDLEFGIQSRVDKGNYIVEAAVSPDNVLEAGSTFVLKDTYCAEVIKQKKTISYLEVAKLNHMREHPVYINMKLESYISTPIWQEGKLYGTLNFSSQNPKKKKFSKEEITFVEIMADLISRRISFYKQQEKLIKTREDAIKASNYKSEFLANMSHEIRTPMNGILGNLTLIEETKLSIEQKELLKTARQSGDGLLSIINDVLDLSKIESGKMGIEKIDFNIREVVEEVVGYFKNKSHEKGLEYSLHFSESIPKLVLGDLVKIKQVLLNFISNAFKFTHKGSIQVTVDLDPKGEVIFSVKDTGQGIEEIKLKSIFDPFTQEDAST
ncbi:MAG: GAF domain-containing protein, partial [Bacteriovoracaceae bacterium]